MCKSCWTNFISYWLGYQRNQLNSTFAKPLLHYK
jgi:hypothetical protein